MNSVKPRKWLIKIRQTKKMTHLEVANAAGIQRAYFTQIENGTRTPSVSVAKQISFVLGFEWSLFFDDKCSEKRQIKTG